MWWVVYLIIFSQGVEIKRAEVGPTMYKTEALCNGGLPDDVANWRKERGQHLDHLARHGIDRSGSPTRVGITKKFQCVSFGP